MYTEINMLDLRKLVFVKTCENESSHTRSVPFFYLNVY